MSIPSDVTGLVATDVDCVGPFQSTSLDEYFFGKDPSTPTTLQAFKANIDSTSWDNVASATGFTTEIRFISAYQIGDVIHLVITDGDGNISTNHRYRTFDMQSDAFDVSETIATGLNTCNTEGIAQLCSSIVVRSTGKPVVCFNGQQSDAPNAHSRVYYSERSSANTWTTPVDCFNNVNDNQYDHGMVCCALGAEDRVHFMVSQIDDQPTNPYCREHSISSANAFDATMSMAFSTHVDEPISATSLISGSDTWVVGVGTGSFFSFISGANPTVYGQHSLSGEGPTRIFNDGTTVYRVYRKPSDFCIYYVTTADFGSHWSAETKLGDENIVSLSRNATISDRAGDFNLPYILWDGS